MRKNGAKQMEIVTATNHSLTSLLENCASEESLTDAQFAEIVAFADAPPPESVPASEDDVRAFVAFLAATLKAPRNGADTNRVKLGAYRMVLSGQPKDALAYAVKTAIRTMEWMPTPAGILSLANSYVAPEKIAHSRAQRLVRDRRQRVFDETIRQCMERALSHDDLQKLTSRAAEIAQTAGAIIIMQDGSRVYRTPETIEAYALARAAMIEDATK